MNKVPHRFVRVINDAPQWVTSPTIRRENPKVGFGDNITDDHMLNFGCHPVYRPVVNPEPTAVQKLVWDDLPTLQGEQWVQGYVILDKTEAELISEVPWQDYTSAVKATVGWINRLTSQIEDLFPSTVQARWTVEEAAARAVVAGTATQAQIDMITSEGASKGRTIEEHSTRVIAKADQFHGIANEVNKLFLAVDGKLEAAKTPLEYPAIFAWAEEQAAPLAAAYGLTVDSSQPEQATL